MCQTSYRVHITQYHNIVKLTDNYICQLITFIATYLNYKSEYSRFNDHFIIWLLSLMITLSLATSLNVKYTGMYDVVRQMLLIFLHLMHENEDVREIT